MDVSGITNRKQHADLNLNTEHGILGPGLKKKKVYKMSSDAGHVYIEWMDLFTESINSEKHHHLEFEKVKSDSNLPLRVISKPKYNSKQKN